MNESARDLAVFSDNLIFSIVKIDKKNYIDVYNRDLDFIGTYEIDRSKLKINFWGAICIDQKGNIYLDDNEPFPRIRKFKVSVVPVQ